MKIVALLAGALPLVATSAWAEGDVDKGKSVFNKCKSCHEAGDNAKNKIGPQLNGIVGAEIASVDGFK